MSSWIAGDISETDALYLKQLIATDPEVLAAWEEFKHKFLPEDVHNGFLRYEDVQWIPAEEITKKTSQPQIRNIFLYVSVVAAMLTGIIAGVLFYNRQVPTEQMTANNKNITLQLANGKTINLSQAQDKIQLAGAKLKNNGKALSYTLDGNNNGSNEAAAISKLTVPIGKDYKMFLADGSEIHLNSGTEVSFSLALKGSSREITVSGEAFLRVAPQAGRPFLVHTPHGTVQVLGTSFNVNTYDSGIIKVALVDGAVQFAAGKNTVKIKPGNEAIYTVDEGIQVQPFDEDETLGWQEGKYYFSDATLQEIVNVLPRWYGTNVLIDNPQLATERFAGMMDRNKPITAFLDNLGSARKIHYHFDNEGVLHLQ
ncbi:FecR family protein [Chitinophaga sp. GbtcB8]|uniref:FecR family protein n=1 Tax=Chitinophaga sp. GbtcB8 TaxID=2824753 RepID=UPI001C30D4C5|nr:FecR domain-containing protein [Chitinophaga sp. GbtcB8]